MIQVSLRSWSFLPVGLTALVAASLVACAAPTNRQPLDTSPDKKGQQSADPETDMSPLDPTQSNDTGAFGKGGTSSSGGSSSGGSSSGGSSSGSAATYCVGDLQAGDLAITEIMISSRSGSGDAGEWVEITSTRDCTLKLAGVTVTSPRGTGTDTATVSDTFELAPHGTFVVVGIAANAAVPGPLFAWNATDVLKNDGDTVTVSAAGTTIDSLTYTNPTFTTGSSLEFPADCAASLRADVTGWVTSPTSFGGSFHGTPNAANTDVACLE